jgi:hypothetical protein
MSKAQSYNNHARWDPPFHYFLLPILLINLIFSIIVTIDHWPEHHALFGWWIVMSFALIVLAGSARVSALKAQDRIIRLEERLRLAALLSPEELAFSQALTESQLIGLRFASDAELPALVARTLKDGLTQDEIKKAIVHWRPDYFRV